MFTSDVYEFIVYDLNLLLYVFNLSRLRVKKTVNTVLTVSDSSMRRNILMAV